MFTSINLFLTSRTPNTNESQCWLPRHWLSLFKRGNILTR